MEWTPTLAVIATVTSFICQFVGVEICFKIFHKGSTGDVSPVPFIAFFVGACVWLKYGLMTNNTIVIITSCQSGVLQFLYIIIYYFYSTNKHLLHWALLTGFISLLAPIVYLTYFEDDVGRATRNVGLYCCFLSVVVYASPLATLSTVIKHKSTQSMSLALCLINFMCAVEWSLYGMAIDDLYVTLPNVVGGVLGLLQMFLFCWYGCKESSSKTILV